MKLTKDNIIEFYNSRLANGVYVNRLITYNWSQFMNRKLTDSDFMTLISFMTTNGIVVRNNNGEYETADEPGPVPPEPTNKILYTATTQPTSTWITNNCSENVFDENTGEGYLVLNEGVDTVEGEYGEPIKSIFNDEGSDSNVESVILPSQITSISDCAFGWCRGLTSITIPNSVTSLGAGAFSGCIGLTSANIGNSVTSIGEYVFQGCSGLTSVTIPNSVKSIAAFAFSGCSLLASVTCEATTPPTLLDSTSFEIADDAECAVPVGYVEAYEESDWSNYFTTFTEIA